MRNARSVIFASAFFMLGVAGQASGAGPAAGERYAGKTSEGLSVRVRVSRRGDFVARMRIRFVVHCADGAQGPLVTDLLDLRIDRHGRFRFNGTYTTRADKSTNHVRMSGRVSRHRARGTFVLSGKRGKVRCHSNRITWHARAVS